MTEDTNETKIQNRRASILPSQQPPSIPEETNENSTIGILINSNPLIDSNVVPITPMTQAASTRIRRRSSVSIHQYANSNALLLINDARKRNFLVGSGLQISDNLKNDMSACFPNGRLLTIMMVTWNTGEAPKLYEQNYTPTAAETTQRKERMLNDMSDILLPTFIEYVSDLIIVCTQEMSATKKRTDWEILLQEVIGPTHVLYHSIHFGTLSLCIFLRRELIWYCTEPEEDIIKFRAVNPVRTKGSLAITFKLFGTSFMIINSHFEAGEGNSDRSNRRFNFQNTISQLKIPHEFLQRAVLPHKYVAAETTKVEGLKHSDSTKSLDSELQTFTDITKSCDCVLWAGDMNFRINMSHKEVLEHVKDSKYLELLIHDEFRARQKITGDPYGDFKEANIEFPPTYKYNLNSTDDIYAKNRTPSYTDRIIFRDKPSSIIECTQYKAVEGVKHSDHKPVVAHFRLKLKPGLYTGDLSYGKFNHEVYRRGCEQREQHHSLGIRVMPPRRPAPATRSSVCVLQ